MVRIPPFYNLRIYLNKITIFTHQRGQPTDSSLVFQLWSCIVMLIIALTEKFTHSRCLFLKLPPIIRTAVRSRTGQEANRSRGRSVKLQAPRQERSSSSWLAEPASNSGGRIIRVGFVVDDPCFIANAPRGLGNCVAVMGTVYRIIPRGGLLECTDFCVNKRECDGGVF